MSFWWLPQHFFSDISSHISCQFLYAIKVSFMIFQAVTQSLNVFRGGKLIFSLYDPFLNSPSLN